MSRMRERLNQSEMVDLIVATAAGQGRREVTQLQARTVLLLLRDITLAHLRDNPEAVVLFTGLGGFFVKHQKARTIKSVRSKATLHLPKKIGLGFKPSAIL